MALIGNESARDALAAAMASGALHHAWLIAGPEGVGKGAFARIAAACGCSPRPASRKARPGWDTSPKPHSTCAFDRRGRASRIIASWCGCPRTRPSPTRHSPARSPSRRCAASSPCSRPSRLCLSSRRVVVIDSIDDLERGGANALLKNLEEPPAGTIFLLVSHAPGQLLPTIRSRCRLLRFEPLPSDAGRRDPARRAAASERQRDRGIGAGRRRLARPRARLCRARSRRAGRRHGRARRNRRSRPTRCAPGSPSCSARRPRSRATKRSCTVRRASSPNVPARDRERGCASHSMPMPKRANWQARPSGCRSMPAPPCSRCQG
jgi:hypothetical protein